MCTAYLYYRPKSGRLGGNDALCASITNTSSLFAMLGAVDAEGDGYHGTTYITYQDGNGWLLLL